MSDVIYVKRDKDNQVTAISKVALPDFTEQLDSNHPDVIAFLGIDSIDAHAEKTFIQSDLQLIRVLEDLIQILIEKNIIRLTELPEEAQSKLLDRKKVREAVSEFLINDTDFDNIDV